MAKANYSTPDTGAWQVKCDDLFLAQFRGRPCEICGSTSREYNGRQTRSCGHHLMEKDLHRIHRYSVENIIVLCPKHHGQYERTISPYSDDTVAVASFYEWVRINKPHQWEWFKAHCRDLWGNEWTYKEMYMIKQKQKMRKELRVAVESIMNKYRVNDHLEHDKAIEHVVAHLNGMKRSVHQLLTDSEWQSTLPRIKEPKKWFNISFWKRP